MNPLPLAAAAGALVLLSFCVGLLLLRNRIREMQRKRIPAQAVATSGQMAARLEHVQAADNFRNLFETPVLFYALFAIALALGRTPAWLVAGAWAYVFLRLVHSVIHCTYNDVLHRFAAFLLGFGLLVGLWAAFVIELAGATAG